MSSFNPTRPSGNGQPAPPSSDPPIQGVGSGTGRIPAAEFKQVMVENTLAHSDLFAGLPQEDLKHIAAFTVVRSLEKQDYLFRDGDVSQGLYVVQSGSVNLHRVGKSGKEQVLHVFRAGETLSVATLGSSTGCPAHARAEELSTVLLVKKQEFIALLQRRPDMVLRVLGGMCTHCRVMCMQIEDLTQEDVETRLSRWLLHRCPDPKSQQPAHITLSFPKRVLASELGTVGETLSRVLGRFRRQNLIEVEGKTITVQSPALLQSFLDHHQEQC